jgi:hypothetical protein
MKKNLWIAGMLMVGLMASGCSEKDDTTEAKIEEAKIAIDNGNYNEAISILSELLDKDGDGDFDDQDLGGLTAEDSEAARLLASAYIGNAGVDMLAVLDAAEQASAQQAALQQRAGVRYALAALDRGIGYLIPPAYAAFIAPDCLNDPNFKIISNSLPLVAEANLDDLDFGLDILEELLAKLNVDVDLEEIQLAELLRAVAEFARMVMTVIEATDTNENNIPDAIHSGTVTAELAGIVETSLANALEAVTNSGLDTQSDLTEAIVELRDKIRGFVNDGDVITTDDLIAYLNDLVSNCNET